MLRALCIRITRASGLRLSAGARQLPCWSTSGRAAALRFGPATSLRRSLTVESLATRVNQAAQRHYDEARGRPDWATVAKELDLPLLDCLRCCSPAQSETAEHSRPKITDWSTEELVTLKEFVAQHLPAAPTNPDWRLVGVFMNINHIDCFRAVDFLQRPKITDDIFDALTLERQAGLKWKQIHSNWSFWKTATALQSAYTWQKYQRKNKEQRAVGEKGTTWSLSETARMCEIIKEHSKRGSSRKILVDAAAAEFPDKSRLAVQTKVKNMKSENGYGYISNSVMNRVKELVDQCGHDWEWIGQELGITPRMAERALSLYQRRMNAKEMWCREEVDLLHQYIKDGLSMAEASRLIGSKSTSSCQSMMHRLQKAPDQLPLNQKWTEEKLARLIHLVDTCKNHRSWKDIAKELGCSAKACTRRYYTYKNAAGQTGNSTDSASQ